MAGGKSDDSANLIVLATLRLENDNPHDRNAVKVKIGRFTVGYLDRTNAVQYRQQLRDSGLTSYRAHCRAKIVGGWYRGPDDEGYYGVKLDLPID